MDGPLDWDLLAVVRSCSSSTTTTTTTTTTTATTTSLRLSGIDISPPPPPPPPVLPPPLLPQHEQRSFSPTPSTCSSSSVLFGFSSPLTTTSFLSGGGQELQDVYTNNINSTNGFQSLSCPLNSSVSSSSIIAAGKSFTVAQHNQQLRRIVKPSQAIFGASTTVNASTTTSDVASQSRRTRKRKSLMKKVCHVPAESLSSDKWAWRKYGQKPIKGSPHPRGYYRCSSSKGCLARKQVERNRSNPKMFIVTYTSEHNHPIPTHRNSLAGSTRHKPLTSTGTPPEQPTCSSLSATSLSPLTEKSESKTEGENLIKDEEDNDMEGISDLMFNDDFYVGFEQIDGGSDDSDCFSEHFSPSSEFPWLVNGSTTATAASGS